MLMGALTFVAGIAIIPEGIAGVFRNAGSAADFGKGIGNIIALLLVFSIAYLLTIPDGFYHRHPRLIIAAGAITTTGGKVTLTAATTLTTTANGTITTTGKNHLVQGTPGGEVFLHSTGAGGIVLEAAVTANGGNTNIYFPTGGDHVGGAGGVVTLFNASGLITVHDITIACIK